MTYNPAMHHRRSIRLKGYDYSQSGLYFITLCCKDRTCLFGKIENGKMNLNDAGVMVKNEWLKLPERFKNIELHEYIVMPNHFHSILEIGSVGATVGATLVVAPTLGDIVGAFKSIVTVNYIRGVKNLGWQAFNGNIWQRNYYEHIIRNELSYFKISVYIKNNPEKWDNEKLK